MIVCPLEEDLVLQQKNVIKVENECLRGLGFLPKQQVMSLLSRDLAKSCPFVNYQFLHFNLQ